MPHRAEQGKNCNSLTCSWGRKTRTFTNAITAESVGTVENEIATRGRLNYLHRRATRRPKHLEKTAAFVCKTMRGPISFATKDWAYRTSAFNPKLLHRLHRLHLATPCVHCRSARPVCTRGRQLAQARRRCFAFFWREKMARENQAPAARKSALCLGHCLLPS